MVRILLVDDSQSVRAVLAERLTERGYDVTLAEGGVAAAEQALASPPDVVVTDLWMPGISGVQLCRLLRAEARTSHVPVVLITGESQRRSRFWARSAGAVAYVAKNDSTALFATLEELARTHPPRPMEPARAAPRTPIQHRLFERLDAALFESTVAGEIRSLAHAEGEADSVFHGLINLVSEVATYRWLGLYVAGSGRLFVHTHPDGARPCEAVARAAFGLAQDHDVSCVADDRAVVGRTTPPVVADIRGGGSVMGRIALGPGERGASREDRDLVAIVAAELGGPLRVVSLVEHAKQLAMSDPLTGLLNRRAFLDSMTRWVEHFERYHDALSLLLLDVDHFKRVNDTHGHKTGDAVLRAIAAALPTATRRTDIVARWGGEEFVVGLPSTGAAGARIAGERVRRAISMLSIEGTEGQTISVTASVGVACATRGESFDTLVSRADQAMYLAKARGRNRVEMDATDVADPPTAETPEEPPER